MSVIDVIRMLFRVQSVSEYDLVIFEFRLPQIVIGALVGLALWIAGAVLQADPGILGIHSAAGMVIILYIFFHSRNGESTRF
ncbi:hypothetical protein AO843_14550 [Lysinibacillus sp. ZYM-1]|nr:hypothetical protein AO843_14550 [Lysinibacillus sp. ZYM-1]